MFRRTLVCIALATPAWILAAPNALADAPDEHGFDLLLETTAEFGFSHSGTKSKGGNWTRWAVNKANEQIRSRISEMANIEELERFTSEEITRSIDTAGEGHGSPKGGGGKGRLKYDDGKKKTEKEWKKFRNNYIVVIDNVRMKKGTDWSDTDKNWKGERSWEASCTVLYDVRIYGKLK